MSLDEMTGIQALERTMPDIPMKPGRMVKREFEYIRHGTQSLIASFNVATGEIEVATVGATRTEQDLEAHVVRLMAKHPTAPKYHVVMDCLNTHQSEALVRLVARLEPEGLALGLKGKSGILQSMPSRAQFLISEGQFPAALLRPSHTASRALLSGIEPRSVRVERSDTPSALQRRRSFATGQFPAPWGA